MATRRKAFRVTGALMGLTMLTASSPAFADVSIKRNIIEDCPAALGQFSQMTEDDRRALLPYLKLVLRMKLDGDIQQRAGLAPLPFEIATPPGPMGGFGDLPLDDQKVSHLWRTFDPTAEAEAKTCAMRLASALGGTAVELLPELVRLADEEHETTDVQDLAASTATRLADFVKQNPPLVTTETLQGVLDAALDMRSPTAQGVLVDLGSSAADFLFPLLPTLDEQRRDFIVDALCMIDLEPAAIEQSLVMLLTAGQSDLQRIGVTVLDSLVRQSKLLTPDLASALSRLAAYGEPEVRSLATRVLTYAAQASGIPELPASDRAALLETLLKLPAEQRSPIASLLESMGPQIRADADSILAALKDETPDMQLTLYGILAAIPDAPPEVLATLSKGADSIDPAIRLAAIRGLGRQPQRARQTLPLFQRILKRTGPQGQSAEHRQLVAAIAYPFGQGTFPTKGAESLVPPLVAMLGPVDPESPAIEEALVHFGEAARTDLTRALNSKEPKVKERAIVLLSRLPLKESTMKALTRLTKDQNPDIKVAAETAIATLKAASEEKEAQKAEEKRAEEKKVEEKKAETSAAQQH